MRGKSPRNNNFIKHSNHYNIIKKELEYNYDISYEKLSVHDTN